MNIKFRFGKNIDRVFLLILVTLFIIPILNINTSASSINTSELQSGKPFLFNYFDVLLDIEENEDESNSNYIDIKKFSSHLLFSTYFRLTSLLIPVRNSALKFQQWSRGTFS